MSLKERKFFLGILTICILVAIMILMPQVAYGTESQGTNEDVTEERPVIESTQKFADEPEAVAKNQDAIDETEDNLDKSQEIKPENIATAENQKNGLIEEAGRTYYYVNGEKQRGIQNIEGNYYYFDWNDYSLTKQGWLHFWPYDNDVYTDKVDGHFHMGLERVSEGSSRDGTYYFDSNNMGFRHRGLKTIDGETYYFDWNSYKIKTGLIYFGGYNKRYAYANPNTGAFTKGRANIDGKTYYFRKDGFSARGIVTDNGRDYYYDWNKYTLVKQGLLYFWPYENYVYTDYNDGHFVKGWKKIGGDQYYFSKENGHMCHEITKVDNKFFYFGSKSGKLYKDGWLYFWPYENYVYTDKVDGHFYMGKVTIKDGGSKDRTYYFNPENIGLRYRGIKTLNGSKYYFDWNSYKLYHEGWIYFGGYNKKYAYADYDTGKFYTGKKKVDGNEIDFGKDGFIDLTLNRDSNGRPYVNYKINGWFDLDDGTYYMESGKAFRGIKTVSGFKYYLDWNTYKLYKKGWLHLWKPDKMVYCDPNNGGAMSTGVKRIDGYTYYFYKDSCYMATDAVIDHVYYHKNGKRSWESVLAKRRLNKIGWSLWNAYVDAAERMPYQTMTSNADYGIDWFANYGFNNYKGNCYVKASMMYYMAKIMGYNVKQMGGAMMGWYGPMPHSWVEVYINGNTYILDGTYYRASGRHGYLLQYGKPYTWKYVNYRPMHY